MEQKIFGQRSKPMRDPLVEFMNYNRAFARRNPDLLRLKVARMAEGPFAFFRGTFHLFARDVLDTASEIVLPRVPDGAELDLVGDIHSENYGTYKAADGLIHYDINDFDETTRGRFDFDVSRLATSLFLAARERGEVVDQAVQVLLAFLNSYTEAARRFIKKGKALDPDISETAPCGCQPLDDLVKSSAAVKRPDFIGKLTETSSGSRRLVRSSRYFNLPDGEREQALRLLEDYRKRMPEPPTADYYTVEDVCGRVAGIGSMGRLRYAVLIAGKGSKDARNVLLEFKESRPSAYDLQRQRDGTAEALAARAERVITVQRQSQAASSAFLGFAVDGGMSFQVREVGPADTRLDVKTLKNGRQLEEVGRVLARILARTHARAVTQAVGPSNPLAELEDAGSFCQRVLAFALAYADLTHRDWARFVGQRAELENVSAWVGNS
jgi:uncharacterized protein (DUF2252 family)